MEYKEAKNIYLILYICGKEEKVTKVDSFPPYAIDQKIVRKKTTKGGTFSGDYIIENIAHIYDTKEIVEKHGGTFQDMLDAKTIVHDIYTMVVYLKNIT